MPAKIILSVDKNKISNSWDDVAFVTAKIYDENGNICPNADQLIKFTISGSGIIDAVDNGNITSHEMYKATQRHAYQGVCMANIKGNMPGTVEIKASADGLESGAIKLEVGNK